MFSCLYWYLANYCWAGLFVLDPVAADEVKWSQVGRANVRARARKVAEGISAGYVNNSTTQTEPSSYKARRGMWTVFACVKFMTLNSSLTPAAVRTANAARPPPAPASAVPILSFFYFCLFCIFPSNWFQTFRSGIRFPARWSRNRKLVDRKFRSILSSTFFGRKMLKRCCQRGTPKTAENGQRDKSCKVFNVDVESEFCSTPKPVSS